MTRLSDVTRDDLDVDGRALHERVARLNASLGEALLGRPLEATSGPANALLRDARLGALVLELGAHVNSRSGLAPRTKEVVIMTVAAHWETEFEWWAHSRMAAGRDIDPSLVEEIATGGFADLPDDDRVLRDLTTQLLGTGHVDEGTYRAAVAAIGEAELVKVICLCGYYTMIAFLLNGFGVAVPAGERSRWRSP
jgi:4-carboxymuconolactone decarboxylase